VQGLKPGAFKLRVNCCIAGEYKTGRERYTEQVYRQSIRRDWLGFRKASIINRLETRDYSNVFFSPGFAAPRLLRRQLAVRSAAREAEAFILCFTGPDALVGAERVRCVSRRCCALHRVMKGQPVLLL
jgi:hypothetical protein